MVLDVGRDNWFLVAQIINYGSDKEEIGIPGNSYRNNIDKIVGKRSKKQILEAMKNYFGSDPTKEEAERIDRYSKKSGRFIS